jgi:hypothetical protein
MNALICPLCIEGDLFFGGPLQVITMSARIIENADNGVSKFDL